MKKLTLTIFVLMLFSPAVLADDVEHYEGKEFENSKAAMEALINTSNVMAEAAAAEDLDAAKMEIIHETSYTTEDAVVMLGKNKKNDVKELAEKLEEVHLASENRKVDEVRRNFITYQAELNEFVLSQK